MMMAILIFLHRHVDDLLQSKKLMRSFEETDGVEGRMSVSIPPIKPVHNENPQSSSKQGRGALAHLREQSARPTCGVPAA